MTLAPAFDLSNVTPLHRAEWHMRGSIDGIGWSMWQFLCYDGEPTPPNWDHPDAWRFNYCQCRRMRNGKVDLISPVMVI